MPDHSLIGHFVLISCRDVHYSRYHAPCGPLCADERIIPYGNSPAGHIGDESGYGRFSAGSLPRAHDNGQYLIYDSKTGALYYDEDGLAETAAVKLAVVGKTSHPDLTIADFLVG